MKPETKRMVWQSVINGLMLGLFFTFGYWLGRHDELKVIMDIIKSDYYLIPKDK